MKNTVPMMLTPQDVGDRFSPTDEQLVNHYLKLKLLGREDEVSRIPEFNIYEVDPWDLPYFGGTSWNTKEMHFFCHLQAKHLGSSSGRINRSTKNGFWEASGQGSKVLEELTGMQIGAKKIFVHSVKKDGIKFVMHQYNILSNKETVVLCKIMKKPFKKTEKRDKKKYQKSCGITKTGICGKKTEKSNKKYKRPYERTKVLMYDAAEVSCHIPNPNERIDFSTSYEDETSSYIQSEGIDQSIHPLTYIQDEANLNSEKLDDASNKAGLHSEKADEASYKESLNSKVIDEAKHYVDHSTYIADEPSLYVDYSTYTEDEASYYKSAHQNVNSSTYYGDKTICSMTFAPENNVADLPIPERIDSGIPSYQNSFPSYNHQNYGLNFSPMCSEQSPSSFCSSVSLVGQNTTYQHEEEKLYYSMTSTPENNVENVTIPEAICCGLLSHQDLLLGYNHQGYGLNFTEGPPMCAKQSTSNLGALVPTVREHPYYQYVEDKTDCSSFTLRNSVAGVVIPEGIDHDMLSYQDSFISYNHEDYGINFAQGSHMCLEQSQESVYGAGTSMPVLGENLLHEAVYGVDDLWASLE